jgi:CRISPR/Cas system-associated exonuclease Cas4 (RecB family)
LRLQPVQSGEDRYALLFGQAVHAALEATFSRDPKDFTRLETDFNEALAKLAPTLEPDLPLVVAMRAHAARLAAKVPRVEEQLAAVIGPATPIAFERPFEWMIEGIRVTGKIDRIDRRAVGTLLVIDYKTGSVDFTPDRIAQGVSFQPLLYLLAAERELGAPVAGMAFYDLKKGELRKGFFREDRLAPGGKKILTRGHALDSERFATLRDHGIEKMHTLAKAIAAGEFAPTPAADVCGRCEYALYCRRSEALG